MNVNSPREIHSVSFQPLLNELHGEGADELKIFFLIKHSVESYVKHPMSADHNDRSFRTDIYPRR